MYNPNYYSWGPEGWRCPVCGRVYSPTTPMCFYCNNQQIRNAPSTTPSTIDDSAWWEEYLKQSTTGKPTTWWEDYCRKTTADSSGINETKIEQEPSQTVTATVNTVTTNPNIKVTSWNSTTCNQKCEECDKYEKSCFGGIETTSSKAIISHRPVPEIHYSFVPPCQEGKFEEVMKEIFN